MELKKQGNRAVMLYVINRENIKSFSPAKDIDPTYASLLKEAKDSGVEVLAYATKLSPEEIYLNNKVEVIL
jgi:sugar fermentation stimulation protein A